MHAIIITTASKYFSIVSITIFVYSFNNNFLKDTQITPLSLDIT